MALGEKPGDGGPNPPAPGVPLPPGGPSPPLPGVPLPPGGLGGRPNGGPLGGVGPLENGSPVVGGLDKPIPPSEEAGVEAGAEAGVVARDEPGGPDVGDTSGSKVFPYECHDSTPLCIVGVAGPRGAGGSALR